MSKDNGASAAQTGLSPSVEPASAVSPAGAASIPSAFFDVVARLLDPHISKLSSKAFTGNHLRHAARYESEDIRSISVAAVDAYHGFTCEFSPWPKEHVEEYNMLEALLAFASEVARGLTPAEAYLSAEAGTRLSTYFFADELAQAIEARSGETGTGSIGAADESAVPSGMRPDNPASPDPRDDGEK